MKKIIDVIVWPLIYTAIQMAIAIIFTIFYNNTLNMGYDELSDFVETTSYQDGLANFLIDNKVFIVIIGALIILPLLYNQYQKYNNNYSKKIVNSNILTYIVIGLLYSLTFNLFFYIIGYYTDIVTFNSDISLKIIAINLVTNVLLGPIIEEYLFRGVVYNRLKINQVKNPILISSFIFALFHLDLLTMMYAFIFNALLIYFYEKSKNIKVPIIIHMSANIGTIIILPLMMKLNIIYVLVILAAILISNYYMYRKVLQK
ncbi:MAG: CPBP family intramembrane metalloprotease [Bacilli bacterium]|nr:CPBP family intramembrane metalloprotease [Bacilli bacterium]